MTLTAWLSLAAVCSLGAMSPGPSLAVILKHSISNSTKHGIIAAIAHGFGVGIYAVGALLGLVSILISLPVLFKILVYSGAAYLLYMGVRALMSKGSPFAPKLQTDNKTTLIEAARDGFSIAFLNPKLAIFFVALFSQFINPETLDVSNGTIMAGTVLGIDTLWYCIVAGMVHHTRDRFSLAEKGAVIDKVAGVVFIGLAVRVVLL